MENLIGLYARPKTPDYSTVCFLDVECMCRRWNYAPEEPYPLKAYLMPFNNNEAVLHFFNGALAWRI